MKKLWLLASSALFPVAVLAQTLPGTQALTTPHSAASRCLQGNAYKDGCPNAPSGAIEFPALLSGYTVRPPWNVAGVDYYVGVPEGTVLADPTTISIAGVTVNATNHTVTVSGNNITLSGINFGLDSGWKVTITGANDTIQNCLFTAGSNQSTSGTDGLVLVLNGSGTTNIVNDEINGNNIAVTPQSGQLITAAGSGILNIEYDYIPDAAGDMFDVGATNLTALNVEYNLIENAASLGTAHGDVIQYFQSNIGSGHIDFNTVYQHGSASINGEGILAIYDEGSGESVSNMTERNNTLISLDAGDNWGPGTFIQNDVGTGSASNMTVYDNYFDPTAITASLWYGAGSAGFGTILPIPSSWYNLTNMKTGALIPVPTKTSPSLGNWVYPDANGVSPSLSSIYAFTPSPATGNVTTGNTITFTLTMNAPTTVTGTPTIPLNSGGVATYVSGSGTKSLVFSYAVGSQDTAATLAVEGVNLYSAPIPSSYVLRLDEEFPGNSLNPLNWTQGWFPATPTSLSQFGSSEQAAFGPTQVVVNNGLSLNAISQTNVVDGNTYNFLSGLITSTAPPNYGSATPWLQEFTFGYFEAEITLPGDGSSNLYNWAAWWLNSLNNPVTGEIDIVEVLSGVVCATFHNNSGFQQTCPPGYFGGTHTFAAWWGTTNLGGPRIDWYYDNKYVGSETSGITSSPMYLVLNYAMESGVGGPNSVPQTMGVNWVHVYQASGTPVTPEAGYAGPGGATATMTDDVGNPSVLSPLTNLTTSFAGLSVNSGGPSTITFSALANARTNFFTSGNGTYTGSPPTSLTATYGLGCTGTSTATPSFSGGVWKAMFTSPASPCTGTLTVTGTGPNTGTATSPSSTFVAGGATSVQGQPFPGQTGDPVGYSAICAGPLTTITSWTANTTYHCIEFDAGTSSVSINATGVVIIGGYLGASTSGNSSQEAVTSNGAVQPLLNYVTVGPSPSVVGGSFPPQPPSGGGYTSWPSGTTTVSATYGNCYGVLSNGTTTPSGGYTIENSDIWALGNGINFSHVTGSNPVSFLNDWIHDPMLTGAQCTHTDGIGDVSSAGGDTVENLIIDHTTVAGATNSNGLAMQFHSGNNAVYNNDQYTNNFWAGSGYTIDLGLCSTCIATPVTDIVFRGNVIGPTPTPVFGQNYGDWTSYFSISGSGNLWRLNTYLGGDYLCTGSCGTPIGNVPANAFWYPNGSYNTTTDFSGPD